MTPMVFSLEISSSTAVLVQSPIVFRASPQVILLHPGSDSKLFSGLVLIKGVVSRLGLFMSSMEPLPLGHRVPSLRGLYGSPSESITLPLATVAIMPQPTAQNVQMVGTLLAFKTGTCVGACLTPTFLRPEVVAIAGVTPRNLRKSRRVMFTLINEINQ